MNSKSDEAFLHLVSEGVQTMLIAGAAAQGFRLTSKLRPRQTDTDGWFMAFGVDSGGRFVFEVWFDRYGEIGERRFWFGIRAHTSKDMRRFVAVLPDRLQPVGTFTKRDLIRLKRLKDWQISPEVPHNMFNQPVVELSGGGHSFYGFYEEELNRSPERIQQMMTRAANFLADALTAHGRAALNESVDNGSPKRMITRLSYNSSNWQRPTGDARKHEAPGTYNHEYGFGHEDWLFREWQIDGWRYAFLQGINRQHARLLKQCRSMTVTLFTIEPSKRRRLVAMISDLEILDDQQAGDALDAFKKHGWYDIMLKEIRDAGGDDSGFGDPGRVSHILNVRFRIENITRFPPHTFVVRGDPIMKLNRYQMFNFEESEESERHGTQMGGARRGDDRPPGTKSWMRQGTPPVECTPEHAKMQKKLMRELKKEFPSDAIVRELNFVDVTVQTATEKVLFEIKCDQQPRCVIRHALGQILEYAFHPARNHQLPVRLCIVGRCEPSDQDRAYLNRLRETFKLPIEYRVVSP